MTIFNNIIDNNYIIYGLVLTTTGFITYLVLKSYFTTTIIDTPNSPKTFNFTPEQVSQINKFMEEGGVLNKETSDKIDEDFKTVLGVNHDQFQADTQLLEDELNRELEKIFSQDFQSIANSGIDYTLILELIDIITNLISHLYLWF